MKDEMNAGIELGNKKVVGLYYRFGGFASAVRIPEEIREAARAINRRIMPLGQALERLCEAANAVEGRIADDEKNGYLIFISGSESYRLMRYAYADEHGGKHAVEN